MGIYDREYYRGETRGSGWFSGNAPVVYNIILINVAVYLLEALQFVDHKTLWGSFAASSDDIFRHGKVWELLTATFLHDGFRHLLWNMLFFFFVGREMESMYGSRDFLFFYLSAAIVSTFVWALINLSTPAPHFSMVGASGAIYGVVVLYALFYPQREVLFMFVIPVRMWMLVVGFLGFQVLTLVNGGDGHTAVESHLAGAGFAYLFKRFDLRWSRLPLSRARRPRLRVISPEPRERAAPRSVGPIWSGDTASSSKPAATAVLAEEQLDARLDEVLAKIAREGRAGLSDEDNRVLQEASRRAKNRRSDRI